MSALTSILQKSGISSSTNPNSSLSGTEKNKTLETRLTNSGLGLDNILGELASVMRDSENESTKLKAIEQVLKMHGVLKDTGAAPSSVNIIIQGSFGNRDINPILFPREVILDLSSEEAYA